MLKISEGKGFIGALLTIINPDVECLFCGHGPKFPFTWPNDESNRELLPRLIGRQSQFETEPNTVQFLNKDVAVHVDAVTRRLLDHPFRRRILTEDLCRTILAAAWRPIAGPDLFPLLTY